MIKLMDLLLETQLTEPDQEKFNQALAILKDDTLDEGIKDKLKKLGLSATIIAALLASPQLTQAQKAPLQQLANQPSITQTIRTGTSVDGIIGQFTSQYKIPLNRIDTLKLVQKFNGKIIKKETKVEKSINELVTNITSKYNLTISQIQEWNGFIEYLQTQGLSGNSSMDKTGKDLEILKQYKKEVNPDFWINTSSVENKEKDIKKIQGALQEVRVMFIKLWKEGEIGLEVKGKVRNVNNPSDVLIVEKDFMPIAKSV